MGLGAGLWQQAEDPYGEKSLAPCNRRPLSAEQAAAAATKQKEKLHLFSFAFQKHKLLHNVTEDKRFQLEVR